MKSADAIFEVGHQRVAFQHVPVDHAFFGDQIKQVFFQLSSFLWCRCASALLGR